MSTAPGAGMRTDGAVLAALIWTLYVALHCPRRVQGRRGRDCGCSRAESRPWVPFRVRETLALEALAVFIASVSVVGCRLSASGKAVFPRRELLYFFFWGGRGVSSTLGPLYGALDQVMALACSFVLR